MNGTTPPIASTLLTLGALIITSPVFSNDSSRPLELSEGEPLQFSFSGNHQRLRAIVSLKANPNKSIALRFKVIADAESVKDYKDLYWRKGKPQPVYFGDVTIIADKQQINIIRGPRGRGSIQYTIQGDPKNLTIQTNYHEPRSKRLITKKIEVSRPPSTGDNSTKKPTPLAAGAHLTTTFTEFKDDAFVSMSCAAGTSGVEYKKLNLFYRAPGLKPELIVGIHLNEAKDIIRAKHFIHSEKGFREKTEVGRSLQLECVSKHNIITSRVIEF